METKTQYTPEQIQEWQKANNMEVFSLAQLCALLMKFEERQNEIAKNIPYNTHPECDVYIINEPKTLFDKWNNQ